MISVTHAEGLKEDNNYYYFDLVRSYVASGDGSASFSFHRKCDSIMVHIHPSSTEFKQDIIQNLLAMHRLIGMKAIFSKSLSISKTVSYTVEL